MGSIGDPPGLGPAGRRDRITGLVGERGFASVRDLARLLAVSEVTVRQDLSALEELGALRRVRGGATRTGQRPLRGEADEWTGAGAAAVAAVAAAFVRTGDVVVLDGGPGLAAVAEAVVARRELTGVTVHVESLAVLRPFAGHTDRFTATVPAGSLSSARTVVPDQDEPVVADIAFLGSAGITPDGVLAHTEPEALTRRRAAFAGRRSIVVLSPPALERPGHHLACTLDTVDACITARRLPAPLAQALGSAGLQVFTTA